MAETTFAPRSQDPAIALRDWLCRILEDLGGDGTCAFLNELSAAQLRTEIFTHVRWLEARARFEGMHDAAEMADVLVVKSQRQPHAVDEGATRYVITETAFERVLADIRAAADRALNSNASPGEPVTSVLPRLPQRIR